MSGQLPIRNGSPHPRRIRGQGCRVDPDVPDHDVPNRVREPRSAVAEQVIRIMCPNVICRKIMSVPIGARGKIVQCPSCRKRIRIPKAGVAQMPAANDPPQNGEEDLPEREKAG